MTPLRLTILAVTFALLAGCGMSQEEARQKLADLNVEYSQESFVEHAAAGDATVVNLFLQAGMNPAASGAQKVLVEASKSGNAEVVQMLLEAGIDPNIRSNVRIPFESIFSPSVIESVGRDRLESRFGEEGIPVEGATSLIGAVAGGNPAVVRTLLEAGADPNAGPEEENQRERAKPLALAVTKGRVEIARALLEAGAEPNVGSSNEGSLLMTAATFGHAGIVDALLEAGADPNVQESDDELTILMLAAGAATNLGGPDVSSDDREEIVRALLEAGADPNLKDEDGNTALAHAIENDYSKVAELLREADAQ